MANRIVVPVLMVLVLLAVGCAAPAGPSASSPSEGGPVQPKVNRAVVAVEPPTRETNEIRHASTPNGWHLTPMHESLLGIDPEHGKKIARLATSWKVEPDGKSVRFQLRKGVRFHGDWGEFTANDLQHQADETRKDDSLAGASPFWRQVLDRIEVVNDHEVIYHLKRPDGNFLDYVSDQLGGMEVTSKKHFDKNGPATIHGGPIAGTGSYQFVSREEGSFIRYQRVPYQHWRTMPDFPELEFRFIKEASTRLAALMANEVHLAALPEDLIGQAAQRPGFKVVQGRVPALRSFVNFDCCAYADPKDYSKGRIDPSSPLLDVRVRKALSKAINRDELNKGFFNNKGTPLVNNPMHPLRMGWNPDWERRFQGEYGFDVAAARSLLAEAGYGPSNPLRIGILLVITPGLSAGSDVAEAIGNYWRGIGVHVELVNMDTATQTARRRAGTLNHVFVMATNSNQWVGIYNMGTTRARLGGFVGNTGPEMEEVDKWLDEISNTLDEQKIENAWRQMGEVLFMQHKFIPLFWHPVEVVVNSQYVGDWVLPGSISGSWTHTENIKAAR